MNLKTEISIESFRLFLQKYRSYLIYISIILVCILAILFIIIPQVRSAMSESASAEIEREKLDALKRDVEALKAMDDESLDNQFRVAVSALPISKDVPAILNAINYAASLSSVSLGNFDFQVGDLGSEETLNNGIPVIVITLSAEGDMRRLSSFFSELSKTLPLSEIVSVESIEETARLRIVFYYKSSPFIKSDGNISIDPLPPENAVFINEILSWNYPLEGSSQSFQLSTSSASF